MFVDRLALQFGRIGSELGRIGTRRLHDTGRSGWWILISLIPVVGAIWLIVLLCLDSQPEANEWGENPKKA